MDKLVGENENKFAEVRKSYLILSEAFDNLRRENAVLSRKLEAVKNALAL
jgi:hypothetical protein